MQLFDSEDWGLDLAVLDQQPVTALPRSLQVGLCSKHTDQVFPTCAGVVQCLDSDLFLVGSCLCATLRACLTTLLLHRSLTLRLPLACTGACGHCDAPVRLPCWPLP